MSSKLFRRVCQIVQIGWVASALYTGLSCAYAQVIDTPNRIYLIAGGTQGSVTGTQVGAQAKFNMPIGIANFGGSLLVVEKFNHTIRRVFKGDGTVTYFDGLLGVCGFSNSVFQAIFCEPVGIAVDASNNIYVAEAAAETIRKISLGSLEKPNKTVMTLAGDFEKTGYLDTLGSAARFHTPTGIAVDKTGNVFVSDTDNSVIRKITPAGAVSTLAGTKGRVGFINGTGGEARFFYPTGMAINSTTGDLYLADTLNGVIRKITPNGVVSTYVDRSAGLALPAGVAFDQATGNLYIADTFNSVIRRVTPTGQVKIVAGTLGSNRSTFGSLPGSLTRPLGVVVINSNQLAVTTTNNEIVGINF